MSHILPALKYDYDALEPIIGTRTLEIHHKQIHQHYIEGLNLALTGTHHELLTLDELLENISELSYEVRYYAGSHYNHSFFWSILSPPIFEKISEKQLKEIKSLDYPMLSRKDALECWPIAELAIAISRDFGSFESFKIKFLNAASSVIETGWAWLVWSPVGNQLKITVTNGHDNPLMVFPEIDRGMPILGLDIWEHAYYLTYENNRSAYFQDFWKVVNWKVANEYYLNAVEFNITSLKSIL